MKFVKWLQNYWYYYKFHTLAALFVIAIAVTVIVQTVSSVTPDLNVYVLTRDPLPFTQETTENIARRVTRYATDFNGDGKVKVTVVPYVMGEDVESNDRTRFSTEYIGGGVMLMLADRYSMEYFISQEFAGSNAAELTEDTCFDGAAWQINGTPFADCAEFRYLDYDLFFTLRRFNDRSWIGVIPGKTEEFENAFAVLGRIISDTPAEVSE